MGKNEDEFARWFDQARFDLAAARDSRKTGHHEWACFQAQQAAEKALKAGLFLHGKRRFRSHSVKDLLQEAAKVVPDLKSVAKARKLDQYYIPTRYPNGLPGTSSPHEFYDETESQECLRLAQSIIRVISRIRP